VQATFQLRHAARRADLASAKWTSAQSPPFRITSFFQMFALLHSGSLHLSVYSVCMAFRHITQLGLKLDPPKQKQKQQEAQLMLTTGSTRLAVSRGQQTWYTIPHVTYSFLLCNGNFVFKTPCDRTHMTSY